MLPEEVYVLSRTYFFLFLLVSFFFNEICFGQDQKSYYQILNVNSTATDREIKQAYYKLARKFHPDRPNGDAKIFQEIHKAYETLIDSDKRTFYDRFGDIGEDFYNGIFNDQETLDLFEVISKQEQYFPFKSSPKQLQNILGRSRLKKMEKRFTRFLKKKSSFRFPRNLRYSEKNEDLFIKYIAKRQFSICSNKSCPLKHKKSFFGLKFRGKSKQSNCPDCDQLKKDIESYSIWSYPEYFPSTLYVWDDSELPSDQNENFSVNVFSFGFYMGTINKFKTFQKNSYYIIGALFELQKLKDQIDKYGDDYISFILFRLGQRCAVRIENTRIAYLVPNALCTSFSQFDGASSEAAFKKYFPKTLLLKN